MIIKNSILKDAIRELKSLKNIFLWLLVLIIILSGFCVGLKETSNNMKKNIEEYYKTTNCMDLKITTNTGLTYDDINSIKKAEDISGIMMVKSLDVITKVKDKSYTIKVNSINKDRSIKNNDYINRLILTSGRYPSTINEGLVEESFLKDNNLSIGSLITLKPEDENLLKAKKIKITGTVKNSYNISNNYETSSLGNGKIDYYIYLDINDFNTNYYKEAYITLNNSNKYDIYSNEYKNYVNNKKEELSSIITSITNQRYETIVSNINDEIANLEKDLNEIYNLEIPEESISESIKVTTEELNYNKEKLNSIKNPIVSITSRNDITSFLKYEDEITKTENVSGIFIILFLVLLIIVCMISITKIINNKKSEITLLKTIGYNNFYISFKYLLFALSFSLLGSTIGSFVFSKIISLILNIFIKESYNIPSLFINTNIHYCLKIILIISLTIITFTYIYLYITIKNKPIAIKRKNLKLKKELIKASIIFALCSFLITTPILLKKSNEKMINNKYVNYDLKIELSNNLSEEKKDEIIKTLRENKITNNVKLNSSYSDISSSSKSVSNVLIVSGNTKSLNKFFNLKSDNILKENGITISAKLAKLLNIKKGDIITLDNFSNEKIKVNKINQDYTNSYLYVTPNSYNKLTNQEITYNSILIKSNNLEKNKLVHTLYNNKNVINCIFKDDIYNNQKNYVNLFSNIMYMICFISVMISFIVIKILLLINKDEFKNILFKLNALGINKYKSMLFIFKKYNIAIIVGIILGILTSALTINNISKKVLLYIPYPNLLIYTLLFIFIMVLLIFIIILVNIKFIKQKRLC